VPPTLVLLHGAGDTAEVWDPVVAALAAADPPIDAVALDLLGRRTRPFDLTRVTLPAAADVAAADVAAHGPSPEGTVLVGHSAGGMVVPFLAARLLERSIPVRRLVFVAGLVAPDGRRVVDAVAAHNGRGVSVDQMDAHRRELLARHQGQVLGGPADGLVPIDVAAAQGLESLNLMFQPISWAGVPDDLPRTFVRCLRDGIQPRELQARLAAACGADEVVDLDSGHTPARGRPRELAAVLAEVVARR
jgi:pimeloyl-ACP methyl ester carboxylesterase